MVSALGELCYDSDIPTRDGSDEEPPDFDTWDEPDALFTEQPIRERMLDVDVWTEERRVRLDRQALPIPTFWTVNVESSMVMERSSKPISAPLTVIVAPSRVTVRSSIE